MTPLRSDRIPPIAPNTSGVAKRSIAANSADQTNTCSRLLLARLGGHDRADRRRPRPPRSRRSRAGAPPHAARTTPAATPQRPRAATAPACASASAAARCTRRRRRAPCPPSRRCARTRATGARSRGRSSGVAPARCRRLAVAAPARRPRAEHHAAPTRRSSPSTSTSALTISTTSPWMMMVRFEASDGSKIVGSRLRCEVPLSSAAEQQRRRHRADRRVAAEQRDRDAEEADCVDLDVVRRQPELPAEHVHRSRKAGEQRRRPPSRARSSCRRSSRCSGPPRG